jgi:DNA-directed RNA polymerase subunit RPC12/RpoP
MPANMPSTPPTPRTRPCPHCGKPYRTLLKRQYGIQIDGGITQSIPQATQWRCLACGKSYTVDSK